MYRNIRNYELRYTDADAYDCLKLSSLLSFLEESACHSADELGFGYKDVAPANIGFILANIYVELSAPIKLGDLITVHTWPLKPTKVIFLRDSEIYTGDKLVGKASARWCMIDTKSCSIAPVSTFFKDDFFDGYNTQRSVEFNNWKIPRIDGGNPVYSQIVGFSDYDHYFHVNNTKYCDYLMNIFNVEELKGKYVSSVQITYVKQCKAGEKIEFTRAEQDGFYLVEGKVNGDLRVQMRLKLNEL